MVRFQSTYSVAHSNTDHSPALFHTQSTPLVAGVMTHCRVNKTIETETRHNQRVTVQHYQLLNDKTNTFTYV